MKSSIRRCYLSLAVVALIVRNVTQAHLKPKHEFGATSHDVDALVFMAIGSVALSPALLWSLQSVRNEGEYAGPLYVITDQKEAVEALPVNQMTVIDYEENHKLIKCRLFEILPNSLQHILFIESAIVVGKPLESFLKYVTSLRKQNEDSGRSTMWLFESAKSYNFYCTNCHEWSTSVMSLHKSTSGPALNAWCNAILQADDGTNEQKSLEVVASARLCQIQSLDRRYLRIMKDLMVVLGFIPTKVFNHYTTLYRPHKLGKIHRWSYERSLGKHRDVWEL